MGDLSEQEAGRTIGVASGAVEKEEPTEQELDVVADGWYVSEMDSDSQFF